LKLLAIILPRAKPAAAAAAAAAPNQSHSVANLIISGVQQKQLNLSPADPSHNSNISRRRESKVARKRMDGGNLNVLSSRNMCTARKIPGEIDHQSFASPLFSHLAGLTQYNFINTYHQRARREMDFSSHCSAAGENRARALL
jgi:hypothetical protein